MSNGNQGVMGRWMRESLSALHQLRRERDQHEAALEAAMEAIRRHTQAIERLETDIELIETAVACSSSSPAEGEVEVVDDFEVAEQTRVHQASAIVPSRPPPLRPVPMHRATG